MKIEKISDNQIRCQLTKEDLAERHIRISELAYGSDKARKLFQDMMEQAYNQFGFSNETNIPLMIEAIPGIGSTLTVVITKVEDPEELDTRFAKFSPTGEMTGAVSEKEVEGADEILDLLHSILEKRAAEEHADGTSSGAGTQSAGGDAVSAAGPAGAGQTGASGQAAKGAAPKKYARGVKRTGTKSEFPKLIRAYRFEDLDDVIRAAGTLSGFYDGTNSLYRLSGNGNYLLVIHQSALAPEDFNKVCNILSEYGAGENFTAAQEASLREHSEAVIDKKALQKLLVLA